MERVDKEARNSLWERRGVRVSELNKVGEGRFKSVAGQVGARVSASDAAESHSPQALVRTS
jgi:hypothetical protein